VFDLDVILTVRKCVAHFEQLACRDREEPDLIEKAQKPRLAGLELARASIGIPHLYSSADELIAARPFHSIDAQVRAANAHGVFRRPCTRWIVFGRDEAMSRIDRRCHRRAEVDVAQAKHKITGSEYDFADVFDRIQSIDAADKFNVA